MSGTNGVFSSWKIIATMSLPMCLFLWSYVERENIGSVKPGNSAPAASASPGLGNQAATSHSARAWQCPQHRAGQCQCIPTQTLLCKQPHLSYLLCVSFGKRQLCRDMKHYLPVPEHRVHRLRSRLPMADIQASSKTGDQGKGGEKRRDIN